MKLQCLQSKPETLPKIYIYFSSILVLEKIPKQDFLLLFTFEGAGKPSPSVEV